MKAKSLFLVAGLWAVAWGCMNVPALEVQYSPHYGCTDPSCFANVTPTIRDLDLIFVIDTSLSMMDEQALLLRNFSALMSALREISGGLPNLHLGVITPDLGTSPYNIPGCEVPGGDGGRFLKGTNNACANPVNQTYVVDVEPRGCNIEKSISTGQPTTCSAHDCSQVHCDVAAFTGLDGTPAEPAGMVFAEDEGGCPRCRNYTDQSLEAVFTCIAALGHGGCGMEQPLEALKQALTGGAWDNQFFLRNNAYLAIFILSDEDDCSARQAELFNPVGDINSTLGTLTSFRCTEFGVICDQPWQRVMPSGPLTYTNCAPREASDPRNMLYPITTYSNTLSQLKDSNMILVGAITGPYDTSLTVGVDEHGDPQLRPSCGLPTEGAVPAVRIEAFVESMLQQEEDRSWAFTSICAEDYTGALAGLGTRIRRLLEAQCLTKPVAGCPDPSFANGQEKLTGLPDAEAAVCEPLCSVNDLEPDGDVTEILPCAATYAGGHPPRRDPALPVPVCFHVTFNPQCAIPCPGFSSALGCDPTSSPWYGPSRGAELVISRRADPAPGTREKIACAGTPLTERLCFNEIDDDFDGHVDAADPDCQ